MAAGEGSELLSFVPNSEILDFDNNVLEEGIRRKEYRQRVRPRTKNQQWIPNNNLLNFKSTTFWERKQENDRHFGNTGEIQHFDRPQRSLFTTKSNQRELQNSFPRSKFQGHGRNENWNYAQPVSSISQNSFPLSSYDVEERRYTGRRSNPQLDKRLYESSPAIKSTLAFNVRREAVRVKTLGSLVNPEGFLTVRLQRGISVDISVNKAIRLLNNPSSIIMALNADGCTAGLIHPSGLVYQYGSRVEITTTDSESTSKFAKMSHKGISFTSDSGSLVYIVDAAGCRSTTDNYSDLSGDFSVPIFRRESLFGPPYMEQCMSLLRTSQYWLTDDGVENWVINGVRISQSADGMVRVNRNQSKYQFRCSPLSGTASITTPYVHCTASIGNACHLFVKRGERRMHYDGKSFIVRNGGQSAGFDEANQVKVF